MRHFRGAGFPVQVASTSLGPVLHFEPIEARNLKLFPAGTEGIHGLNSQAILVVAHRQISLDVRHEARFAQAVETGFDGGRFDAGITAKRE